MQTKKLRILVGLYEISGILSGVSIGLSKLGHSVTYFPIVDHPFAYDKEQTDKLYKIPLQRLMKFWFKLSFEDFSSGPYRIIPNWLRYLVTHTLYFYLALKYDLFIFSAGLSFSYLEKNKSVKPFAFRLFKRRWAFIFTGTDSRAPYCNRTGGERNGEIMLLRDLEKAVIQKRERIRDIENVADLVVDSPNNAHFHEKPYLNLLQVRLPIVQHKKPAIRLKDKYINILHAPSNPGIKGTTAIRAAIQSLTKKGYLINYQEVFRQPNDVVLEKIRECDLVIDQIFSDTPLAGFAGEAASLGKPVIVGGYLWPYIDALEDYDCPPVIRTTPDELEQDLEKLFCAGKIKLAQRGDRLRRHVSTYCRNEQVAQRLMSALYGDVPEHWWLDPSAQANGYGCGVHFLEMLELVLSLKATGQVDPLRLPPSHIKLRSFYTHLNPEQLGQLNFYDKGISEKECKEAQFLLQENINLALSIYGTNSQGDQDDLQALKEKLNNFRGMIERRDRRIRKLERRLHIKRKERNQRISPKQGEHANGSAKPSVKCLNSELPDSDSVSSITAFNAAVANLKVRNILMKEIHHAEIERLHKKIDNFRRMITRRNARIHKLETQSSHRDV